MKPEQKMWSQLKNSIGNSWHATRHEDGLSKGIPDVSFGVFGSQGWIELKVISDWPKDRKAIVQVKHFTKEQKSWIYTRGMIGGRCWLLLKIEKGNQWLLFNHKQALLVGTLDGKDLTQAAKRIWTGVPGDEFLTTITQG